MASKKAYTSFRSSEGVGRFWCEEFEVGSKLVETSTKFGGVPFGDGIRELTAGSSEVRSLVKYQAMNMTTSGYEPAETVNKRIRG